MFLQNALIAVALIEIERDIDACARPAHRAVEPPQELIFIDAGCDLRKAAAFVLPIENVADVLARKGGVVRQIGSRIEEDLTVSRPARAFARGTVGREIRRVALKRPKRHVPEALDERMRTDKGRRLFQVAVNGDRGEVLLFKGDVRFDLRIPESAVKEFRGVFVDAVSADILDLLLGRGNAPMNHLDIFLRQFAVLHHLAEADTDALPRAGGKTEGKIPRKILRELQDLFPRRRKNELFGGKTLVFLDKDVIGCREICLAPDELCLFAICGRFTGIHPFAVLEVGKANGAVVAPPPASVRADAGNAPFRVIEFQLQQKFGDGAERIRPTLSAV